MGSDVGSGDGKSDGDPVDVVGSGECEGWEVGAELGNLVGARDGA